MQGSHTSILHLDNRRREEVPFAAACKLHQEGAELHIRVCATGTHPDCIRAHCTRKVLECMSVCAGQLHLESTAVHVLVKRPDCIWRTEEREDVPVVCASCTWKAPKCMSLSNVQAASGEQKNKMCQLYVQANCTSKAKHWRVCLCQSSILHLHRRTEKVPFVCRAGTPPDCTWRVCPKSKQNKSANCCSMPTAPRVYVRVWRVIIHPYCIRRIKEEKKRQ